MFFYLGLGEVISLLAKKLGSSRRRFLTYLALPSLVGGVLSLTSFFISASTGMKVVALATTLVLFQLPLDVLFSAIGGPLFLKYRRYYAFAMWKSATHVVVLFVVCLGWRYLFLSLSTNVIFLLLLWLSVGNLLVRFCGFVVEIAESFKRWLSSNKERPSTDTLAKRFEQQDMAGRALTVLLVTAVGFRTGDMAWACVGVFLGTLALYQYLRSHYLHTRLELNWIEYHGKTVLRGPYTNVYRMRRASFYLSVVLFLAYCGGILQPTAEALANFYAIVAGLSATILGIVMMFGILLIGRDVMSVRTSKDPKRMAMGLKGFALTFIVIIVSAIIGSLTVADSGASPINTVSQSFFSSEGAAEVTGFVVFLFTLFFVPSGMLYLFGMVSDYLVMVRPSEQSQEGNSGESEQ